ncbi:MAG: hypothetical protein ACE5KE_13330 [Methanosarcinales archaeon]
MIELLITHPRTQYTKNEIAECAGIRRATLYKFWDTMVHFKIIKPTRRVGNTTLYKVNMENEAVKALKTFQHRLADLVIEEQLQSTELEKKNTKKNTCLDIAYFTRSRNHCTMVLVTLIEV